MLRHWLTPTAACGVAYLATNDPLIVAATFVLWLIWAALQPLEGPPILSLALTMQWVQVSVGLFYAWGTGRSLMAFTAPALREMVAIGLVCLVALAIGILGGQRLVNAIGATDVPRPASSFTFKTLFMAYFGSVATVAAIQTAAWEYPSLTQAMIALSYVHLALLYLVFRQLFAPTFRWPIIAALLAFEVGLGFTGFFANFREPLILAAIASLEVFDSRKAAHWLAIGSLAVVMVVAGMFWISVRGGYRQSFVVEDNFVESRSARLERIQSLAGGWASRNSGGYATDMDALVDRLWVVFYPALVVERVPKVIAHTDGALMRDVLIHLATPRVFFAEKRGLVNESELVRKYAGVWVAGEKEGTTIAFGYAAESYVDFGVPLMFLPVFIYGLMMGMVYQGFLRIIRHRDLAIGFVTILCWLSLYQFEVSWAKMVGMAGTLIIYVGALTFVFDRLWLQKFRNLHPVERWAPPPRAEFDRYADPR